MTKNNQDLNEQIAALTARVAELERLNDFVPEIVVTRYSERELARRMRLADIFMMARDERNAELSKLPPLERVDILRNDPIRLVLEAPEDLQEAWLNELPASERDRVLVHLIEFPDWVRVCEPQNPDGTTKRVVHWWGQPVPVSPEKAAELIRAGYERFIFDAGSGALACNPIEALVVGAIHTRDVVERLCALDARIADQVADGAIKIRSLTQAEAREHQLDLWARETYERRDERRQYKLKPRPEVTS